MKQKEMHELLEVSDRTLRDWKKNRRNKLYTLLEALDYEMEKKLLNQHDTTHFKQLIENEKYYNSLRDFERDLYETLTSGRDNTIWLQLSKDTSLSKEARARAAYLYSFLTRKPIKSSFEENLNTGLFHSNKRETGNGLAKLYGLKNGIDMQRFNQYKMTGRF
jgi:succinate dehydrogenase flavin-adding protein (antitoxin of CptAB toxin-antitoxin module)